MIFMLRCCTGVQHMHEAVSLWRSADGPLVQLDGVAKELSEAYARGQPEPAWLQWQLDRINGLNTELEPLTNGFSLEVAQGAIWLGKVLFAAVFLTACIASLL